MSWDLERLWEGVKRTPTRRMLSTFIPAERVSGEALRPPSEATDLGYFQIRLAEMFLRDRREFLNEWAPATLFSTQFQYGGKTVDSPFFVSNRMLQSLQDTGAGVGKTGVSFLNTRVAGPVPYAGDDVVLFAGLFRTRAADLRKSLFAVFDTLFGVVDVGGLGAQLKLADKLSAELFETLGLGADVECRLGERRVFGSAVTPLRDCYLVLVNTTAGEVDASKLAVSDGLLHIRDGDSLKRFDRCDYCLIRVEMLTSRPDFASLPFHALFRDAQRLMPTGKTAEAKSLLIRCLGEVVASPDLSEAHRYGLIEYYQVAFLKDQQRFALLHGSDEPSMRDGKRAAERGGWPKGALLQWQEMRSRMQQGPSLSPSHREALTRIDSAVKRAVSTARDAATTGVVPEASSPDAESADIAAYLARATWPVPKGNAADLVEALAVGAVAR